MLSFLLGLGEALELVLLRGGVDEHVARRGTERRSRRRGRSAKQQPIEIY